ncbi:GTP cyclohydrolase I FolE2 [Microbulbifer flavimaris]|uniref:GTP cyclohydrolase FolE2 n=1 Tax=Microbulbifer flavimaris TaxID=1781068 RepID=A0ABX4I374_9GAMM|nr:MULTISPECIES: GTP cyclohydrolase FolE2 [Microbulbifer]KUJ84773.1 GTP cyclohydrolase FolE2 [Microbulbifer sp. ZGT114]PCO06867.1 GTP cyclohydrolase I FolE2 [Microbulbifer flavimaris]
MQYSGSLPDIAKTQIETGTYPLQWVGMEGIAAPINIATAKDQQQVVAAKANVYVSLDDAAEKGIHMSRLHAILNELSTTACDKDGLGKVLKKMVNSQAGISQGARIELAFDLLLPKPSLLSNETGYQTYPIEICGQLQSGQYDYELKLSVPYSSTCPCSAALSRQLLANAIDSAFATSSIDKQTLLTWVQAHSIATPHSQRSYAYLNLSLGDNPLPFLPPLIFGIEEAIGTPVQTMVKRSDEQEFARLNADNLMFCEDAARRIKAMLEQSTWIKDYWFKVEHQESLHAHDAVVIDRKFPAR